MRTRSAISRFISLVIVLSFVFASVPLQAARMPGANVVVASGGSLRYPHLALTKEEDVWIIWMDESTEKNLMDIARSDDGGATFGFNTAPVDQAQTYASDIPRYCPRIADTYTGELFLAWVDMRAFSIDGFGDEEYYIDGQTSLPDGTYAVFMNKTWNMTTWWTRDPRVSDKRMTRSTLPTCDVEVLRSDATDRAVYVWTDDRNGDFDIYLDQTTQNGLEMFTDESTINDIRIDDTDRNTSTGDNSSQQDQPRIAVKDIEEGNTIEAFIVWRDTRNESGTKVSDIYFGYASDEPSANGNGDGNIDSDEINSSVRVNARTESLGIYSTADQPDIAVDASGNVYVVWRENRRTSTNFDIYFAKGTQTVPGTYTFADNSVKVNDDTGTAEQRDPVVCVQSDTGNVHVAWTDARNGDPDIYYALSTNGGASFAANARIDIRDTAGVMSRSVQDKPTMNVDDAGNAYIAWRDGRNGDDQIYFARISSKDDGLNPTAPDGAVATSGVESVDVEWNASLATDLDGYNVYRREVISEDDEDETEDEETTATDTATDGDVDTEADTIRFALADYELVSEKVTDTWYHDETASPGSTYAYVITATDVARNESAPSEEAETANPVDTAIAGTGGGGCFLESDRGLRR